ncbi:MAG: argininosuccinate lyase [Microbacteriaceae bacterium]|nr:argininosuccinate lyase [Microbacteriaceae bacterium]
MAGHTGEGSLWGGRFSAGPDEALARLSKSTHFDWRLVPYDLDATAAHARALCSAGHLSTEDLATVVAALATIREDFHEGRVQPSDVDEDVHGALERILIGRIGETLGGSLRAGRSRNDQIATFVRMYARDSARSIRTHLLEFARIIIQRSEDVGDAAMPGRTHFQHAQPVLVAHYLLAHAWPLVRDIQRLDDWASRNGVSPYGGGALAGGGLSLDPEAIAHELGFDAVSPNSLDGTSSRDVVTEFMYIAAQIGIDLSRLAEEVIIYSSAEFSYMTLDDAFATGSSMMPQKKNPDIAELTRGKSGRLIGNLTGLLATLKGLPLAYNRDLQEDKEPLFDSVDTLLLILPAMAGLMSSLQFNLDQMHANAAAGFSLATDVADHLVRTGVPFREAHEIVGELVAHCERQGIELHEVSDEQLAGISPDLTPDVRNSMSVEFSLGAKGGVGGTAAHQVAAQRSELSALIQLLDRD